MKKLIALLLALTLALSLAACREKKSGTMTGDEAQKFVDDMVKNAQKQVENVLPQDAVEDMAPEKK